MKITEVRQLGLEEIREKREVFKKELFGLRVAVRTGKLEKNHRLRDMRRTIARLSTVERELEEARETKGKKK